MPSTMARESTSGGPCDDWFAADVASVPAEDDEEGEKDDEDDEEEERTSPRAEMARSTTSGNRGDDESQATASAARGPTFTTSKRSLLRLALTALLWRDKSEADRPRHSKLRMSALWTSAREFLLIAGNSRLLLS